MSEHVNRFLDRMTAVFGEPRSANPELFIGEYARMLKKFTPAAMEIAATEIIDGMEKPFWPSPGEAYVFLKRAAAELHAQAQRQKKPDFAAPVPDPSPEEAARVRALNEEFRAAMANTDVAPDLKKGPPDVSRAAFELMQRNAAKTVDGAERHIKPQRMTGERT